MAVMRVGRRQKASLTVPRWYYAVTIFFILHTIEGFHYVDWHFYGAHGGAGDVVTRSLNILLILASVVLIAWGGRRASAVGAGASIAVSLSIFLLCSALWSVDPGATFRQGLIYLPMVVGGIGIASNLDGDEYMYLLARTCFWAAMASLLLLVHVSVGVIGTPWQNFQGVFAQKNQLGEAMQMGALASLHGLRAGHGRRLWNTVYLCGALLLALMSASMTSCVIIVAFCAASVVSVLLRRGGGARFLGTVLIITAVPALIYLMASPDALINALGRNPTLTGRTKIWAAVIPFIWQRPILGWGFMAFWSPSNAASGAIAHSLGWGFSVNEAHNGLYEALLEVGVLGTALFVFVLARNMVMATRCLRTRQREWALTCLFSCVGILMLGVSEEVLVTPLAATTSVFFVSGFMCEKAVRTAGRQGVRKPRAIGSRSAVDSSGTPSSWRSRAAEGPMQGHGWRRRAAPEPSRRWHLPGV